MAGRTRVLQQDWQSSEKSQNFKEKTQYLMNTLYFIRKDTTHSKGFVRPSRHYWLLITKRGCDSQVVANYIDLLVKNEWLRTMSWKKKGTN